MLKLKTEFVTEIGDAVCLQVEGHTEEECHDASIEALAELWDITQDEALDHLVQLELGGNLKETFE